MGMGQSDSQAALVERQFGAQAAAYVASPIDLVPEFIPVIGWADDAVFMMLAIDSLIERAGLRLPEMYRLGYANANCVGCVKGGAGYWNKIRRDFPELLLNGTAGPEVHAEWFAQVCERTARMVAEWMRVGFVHGVMNTDNMSILGLTIDYGPYGWLEGYDPQWTPNTTDAQGRRYCYGNQPHIAQWNLARLAEALLGFVEREALEEGDLRPRAEAFLSLLLPRLETRALGHYRDPEGRLGELRISGARRYSDRLVENLAPFRPGDVYDRDQLLVYQRRLLESGYFVSVQADIDPGEGKPQASPVRVAVIEASKHHFEAGLGYSTDAGPRLELRYSNQDLLDSAWRLRSALRVDDKIRNLQAEFDSPPRPGGRWNSLFARARDTDIQNETTRELAAGVSHNWGAEVAPAALIASVHIEEQLVAGVRTDERHALYGGFRRSYRRTDDFVAPRSGYMAMFEVGGAPADLASRPFLRGYISGSLFIPNGRRGDILLRGQAGRVLAEDRTGIPSSFLFRTGGDQTVRGYAFESLGVRQGTAVVGGRRMVAVSAEYTHWFGESWGLAGFVDAGEAWDDGDQPKAAVGVGIGARFRTPIGPIRADVAYGERVGSVRLHFSVGYTF